MLRISKKYYCKYWIHQRLNSQVKLCEHLCKGHYKIIIFESIVNLHKVQSLTKCTQQKLLNERQTLPKLRIHRVSIKHQLQLMIFFWGGAGRDKWYQRIGGGVGWNLFEKIKREKKLPHTLTPNSSQPKLAPTSGAAYFGHMAVSSLPSFLFSTTSPIPFQYQPIHTPTSPLPLSHITALNTLLFPTFLLELLHEKTTPTKKSGHFFYVADLLVVWREKYKKTITKCCLATFGIHTFVLWTTDISYILQLNSLKYTVITI